MVEIKECPFCGKKDTVDFTTCVETENCVHFEECPEEEPYYCVVCNIHKGGCGASGGFAPTRQEAVEKWNRRPAPENPPCADCSGIVYRQTNSGKIIPVDQRCGEKITPPCYQPDGDGCAYQIYGDNNDEPIDRCKACPLCYSDKVRHIAPENKAFGLPQCDKCDHCGFAPSKKTDGWTYYCKLTGRDVGQSYFGHNSPRVCPLRAPENKALIEKAYKALLHAEIHFYGTGEVTRYEECKEAEQAVAELLQSIKPAEEG